MIHELKTWPLHFIAISEGKKRFELRKNDRNFQIGDELLLKEWQPENYWEDDEGEGYTGKILHRKITYILKDEKLGLQPGYVILGIETI